MTEAITTLMAGYLYGALGGFISSMVQYIPAMIIFIPVLLVGGPVGRVFFLFGSLLLHLTSVPYFAWSFMVDTTKTPHGDMWLLKCGFLVGYACCLLMLIAMFFAKLFEDRSMPTPTRPMISSDTINDIFGKRP